MGGDILDKIFKAILEIGKISFIPSIHLIDIMVGIIVAALIKVIVYTKGKNAKKFRQGKDPFRRQEYRLHSDRIVCRLRHHQIRYRSRTGHKGSRFRLHHTDTIYHPVSG